MRLWFAAALLLIPAVALADPPGIQVQDAWSRAMPAGATGVVYLTITDRGPPNALTGVSSPVASKAELHESVQDNGVMKMRPIPKLPISSTQPAVLKPGGYHIMLMGLKQPLVAGSSFPVTLEFANGGSVTVNAAVQKPGAAMPGMGNSDMGMHDMNDHGATMGGNSGR
jgi:copper(I)-binding protein